MVWPPRHFRQRPDRSKRTSYWAACYFAQFKFWTENQFYAIWTRARFIKFLIFIFEWLISSPDRRLPALASFSILWKRRRPGLGRAREQDRFENQPARSRVIPPVAYWLEIFSKHFWIFHRGRELPFATLPCFFKYRNRVRQSVRQVTRQVCCRPHLPKPVQGT